MQNKIIYILLFLIIITGLLYLIPHNHSRLEREKIVRLYSKGKTTRSYKKGKDSVKTVTKTTTDSAVIKPSRKDSTYNYTKTDSNYTLQIKAKQKANGNLDLKYFLTVKAKQLIRIDTVFRFRVDTVKITKTIIKKVAQPFYNTFIFGAIITGSIILLLINILH